MLARLILVLLLALAATPATAAPAGCHDMAVMADVPHAPARDHPVAADHGCIGCAAIGDWLAERVRALPVMAAIRPLARPAALLPRAAGPPRLPPPRIG